jgi:hypothetical protein
MIAGAGGWGRQAWRDERIKLLRILSFRAMS